MENLLIPVYKKGRGNLRWTYRTLRDGEAVAFFDSSSGLIYSQVPLARYQSPKKRVTTYLLLIILLIRQAQFTTWHRRQVLCELGGNLSGLLFALGRARSRCSLSR